MTDDDDGPGWQRLHPASPLLRGWRALLVVAAGVGQQQWRGSRPAARGLGILAAATVVGALAVALVAWWRTRYRLTATQLQVDSGILRRRSRRLLLARLQAVDVVRPVAARVLGLAELRLDMVGGLRAEAPLAYLAEKDAHRLRRQMLAAASLATDLPPDLALVVVPTGTLLASVLLGRPAVATGLVLALAAGTAAAQPAAVIPVLAAALPLYVGTLTVAGRRVLTEYGFTVTEEAAGLRLRHGLLDTRSSTIPPGRVQGVRLEQPLLWRPWGWARVEFDVAGYGGRPGEQRTATRALLPVAPLPLAAQLIGRVLTGPLPLPRAPVPARARWLAPLSRRRLRVGLDERHVVVTSGCLTVRTEVVPLGKLQGLRLTCGPVQRALGLATVHLDTAGRRLPAARARHRDQDEARQLLATLVARADAARRPGPGGDPAPSGGRA